MSANVFAQLRHQIFHGHQYVPPVRIEQKPNRSLQKQAQPFQAERKLNRTRQSLRDKPHQGSLTERRFNKQSLPSSLSNPSKNFFLLLVKNLFINKLKFPFEKIRAFSEINHKEKIKRLTNIHKLFIQKKRDNMSLALNKLVFNSVSTNKQLSRISTKNQRSLKYIKQQIGKQVFIRQLAIAFNRIKLQSCKNTSQKAIWAIGLVKIFDHLTKPYQRAAFLKLKENLQTKKQGLKLKSALQIITMLQKQKLIKVFSNLKYFKNGIQVETQTIKKSGSMKNNRSFKRETQKEQSTSDLISEQLKIKQLLSKKQKELVISILSHIENQKARDREFDKYQALKRQLSQKKAQQKQIAIHQQHQDDQIRVHHNDPIFFKKLKEIYLYLKKTENQTIDKSDFIKHNHIDFKNLLSNPQYLLNINTQLKAELKRIDEFLSPNSTKVSINKISKEIQNAKSELTKENQVLKKTISKYVTTAYDTQWLFEQARKLQQQLNQRLLVQHK